MDAASLYGVHNFPVEIFVVVFQLHLEPLKGSHFQARTTLALICGK